MPQTRPAAAVAPPASTSIRHVATLSLRRASPTRAEVTPDTSKTAPTTVSTPEPRTFPGVTEPEPTAQRWHAGMTAATDLTPPASGPRNRQPARARARQAAWPPAEPAGPAAAQALRGTGSPADLVSARRRDAQGRAGRAARTPFPVLPAWRRRAPGCGYPARSRRRPGSAVASKPTRRCRGSPRRSAVTTPPLNQPHCGRRS
jgi:hypothetical protein